MTRFFFHVHDGRSFPDPEGTELSDIFEAQAEAARLSGELLREIGREFWERGLWKMDVTDHTGLALFTLTFTAVEHAGMPAKA